MVPMPYNVAPCADVNIKCRPIHLFLSPPMCYISRMGDTQSAAGRCYRASAQLTSWLDVAHAELERLAGETDERYARRASRAAYRHAKKRGLPTIHPDSSIRGKGRPPHRVTGVTG